MIFFIRKLYATTCYIAYSLLSSKEELLSVVEDYTVSFYHNNIEYDMIKEIVEEKYKLKISETKDKNKIKEIELFLEIFVAYYCEEMTKDYSWFEDFRNDLIDRIYKKLIRKTKWYVFSL